MNRRPIPRLALLLGLLVAGCGRPTLPAGVVATAPVPAEPPPYTLKPGDQIDVKFFYRPELNESLVVRPDGFVTVQLVGDVAAGGLTPPQLAARIKDRMAEHIRDAETAVIVRSFAQQLAYVGGEVTRPGPVSVLGGTSLAQAVLLNGGATSSAERRQALLVRHGEKTVVYVVDLQSILEGRKPDLPLEAYDVVFVPPTRIARVGQWVEQHINAVVPRALSFPIFLFQNGLLLR